MKIGVGLLIFGYFLFVSSRTVEYHVSYGVQSVNSTAFKNDFIGRVIKFNITSQLSIQLTNLSLSIEPSFDDICQDINKESEISLEHRRYIEENLGSSKVHLLLSTTYERLPFIHYTLMGIDTELLDSIYLVLHVDPHSFAVNVPTMLLNAFPNLIIILCNKNTDNDDTLSNILVPLRQFPSYFGKDDIFITVLDGFAYSLNLVDTLVYATLKNPTKTAISISGFDFLTHVPADSYDFQSCWPSKEFFRSAIGLSLFPVEVIEQFAGCVFRRDAIDVNQLLSIANERACMGSPDVILSWSLTVNGINLLAFPPNFQSKKFSGKNSVKQLDFPQSQHKEFEENIKSYFGCAKHLQSLKSEKNSNIHCA